MITHWSYGMLGPESANWQTTMTQIAALRNTSAVDTGNTLIRTSADIPAAIAAWKAAGAGANLSVPVRYEL